MLPRRRRGEYGQEALGPCGLNVGNVREFSLCFVYPGFGLGWVGPGRQSVYTRQCGGHSRDLTPI